MKMDKKTLRISIYLALVCLFIGGIYLFSVHNPKVDKVLNTLNVVPKPETYTELYFEDYESLPRASVSGQNLSFNFVIHNLEGEEVTYRYKVYFAYSAGDEVTFKEGKVTVPKGSYESVNISHTFFNSDLKGKVVVELVDFNQHIDLLLPKND